MWKNFREVINLNQTQTTSGLRFGLKYLVLVRYQIERKSKGNCLHVLTESLKYIYKMNEISGKQINPRNILSALQQQ